MIIVPMQLSQTEYDLFVILEEENIERIKARDPAEIVGKNLGVFAGLKIRNVVIMYANAEEVVRLSECRNLGDMALCLSALSRGWKYRPEQGDSDAPYQAPAKN